MHSNNGGNLLFAILLGALAYTLMNTGMGTQKSAAQVWLLGKAMFRKGKNRRQSLIWCFGLLQAMIGMSLLPVAISYSSISTIAPLSGFGLVVLALFSRFVLGERLSWSDLAAMGVILLGTLWLGIQLQPPCFSTVDEGQLWLLVGLSLGVVTLACVYSIRHQWRWAGPIFSVCAALMTAHTLLFSRLFAHDVLMLQTHGATGIWTLATNLYVHLYILFNAVALIPQQIAYQRARAIVVIPIYSALLLALPILGAVLLFGETLSWQQGGAILVVLVGVFLLTAFHSAEVPPHP